MFRQQRLELSQFGTYDTTSLCFGGLVGLGAGETTSGAKNGSGRRTTAAKNGRSRSLLLVHGGRFAHFGGRRFGGVGVGERISDFRLLDKTEW